MNTLAKKFVEPITLGLALSTASCTAVQQPKEPEPIVVEIEGPQRDLVEIPHTSPLDKRPPKPKPEEWTREEKISYILKNVTGETRQELESEIGQFKLIIPPQYAACRMSQKVQDVQAFARAEEEQFQKENPEKLYLCTTQHSTVLEWNKCRDEVFDQDPTLGPILRYTHQVLLECMEGR
ncbi:hypothetical protein KC725_03155 [Candidatus Peregrinibacteria bacterium]|nr:hypothetical protein [Candidatus Peregrinibacteria bacterium]